VYVAGSESTANPTVGKSVAKYWKNGIAMNLSNGSTSAHASCIAVSGNDIYVAGYESNASNDIATYWKNGIPVFLTEGSKTAGAGSIFIAIQ